MVKRPSSTVIEKTAIELAAVYYEAGRSTGLTSKYKSPRAFARHNFERFIPKAVELLMSMLDRPDIADLMKNEIYSAILERANAPELAMLGTKHQ